MPEPRPLIYMRKTDDKKSVNVVIDGRFGAMFPVEQEEQVEALVNAIDRVVKEKYRKRIED